MPHLVLPSATYQTSFIEAVREAQALGSGLGDLLDLDADELERDFAAFVRRGREAAEGHALPPGIVPQTEYWLVEGETYLGRVKLRHTLNERLRLFGGHIGYEVRPSRRRQGHATLILKLALERARDLGLERVLLTCDDANVGSWKVIEANGGVCEGTFQLDFYDRPIRRYWIACGS